MNLYLPQPAYKIYAFDRGWRVLNYVTKNLFLRTDIEAKRWYARGNRTRAWGALQPWYGKYCAWVVIIGMGIAGATQYVSAMLIAALFIAVQALLLSIWSGICLIGMGILSSYTFLYSRFYRIFCRCPNCHMDMPIPIYICPTCGTEHSRLWPSIYGVFVHRCKTCNTKLPTLGSRRAKLLRICANSTCRRPLNIGIGAGTNVHIPIIGGPSVGKTNYIVTATRMLRETYQSYGYTINFTDKDHEDTFNNNIQSLQHGNELLKTTIIVPQAYNLSIRAPRARVPKLAYVYDAAGEAFNSNENTSQQEYYKYVDGLIFIIDPCAIPRYHYMHQHDISALKDALRPGVLDIMQTYERMIHMFEASLGLRKLRRYTQPVAVVITKVDALNLEYEIGAPAAQIVMSHNPALRSEGDAMHHIVREFLCDNELDHFVRDLETHFANVRYFSCSSLGRLPSQRDTRSFTPIRVLEPLEWLLSQAKVVKAPKQKHVALNPPPTMTMQQQI